jgi:hypothetical protein
MECAFAALRMAQTIRNGACWVVEDLIGVATIGMSNARLLFYLAELCKEKDAEWILQKKREYDAIVADNPRADGICPQTPTWVLHERLGALSAIQLIAVQPEMAHDWFKEYFSYEEDFLARYEKLFAGDIEYDWDEIMRRVNLFYDDFEEVTLIPNWQRRLRAAVRLEQRITEYGKRDINSNDSPERKATDVLLGRLAAQITPVIYAAARAEWLLQTTSVAFALAAYRADNDGENPDTLVQLVPKYLDSVPYSPYTGMPLRYVKRENDVLIANDDAFKLDGSEEDVEKMIADAQPGFGVYPSGRSFLMVVSKR